MKRLLFLVCVLAVHGALVAEDRRPLLDLRVLRQFQLPDDGGTITINRVVPPALPVRRLAAPTPAPTAQEVETQTRRASKEQRMLFLSATGFDREVTLLRWFVAGREVRAWSNLDFNYLRGCSEIETADALYSLFFGFGEDTRASQGPEAAAAIPTRADFRGIRSAYFLVGAHPLPEPAVTLAGLDALHRHFDAHRPEILAAWEKREQARLAHEQWVREHPPAPAPPLVLNFWPGKDTVLFDAPAAGGQP